MFRNCQLEVNFLRNEEEEKIEKRRRKIKVLSQFDQVFSVPLKKERSSSEIYRECFSDLLVYCGM